MIGQHPTMTVRLLMPELSLIARFSMMHRPHRSLHVFLVIVITLSYLFWNPERSQAEAPREYQVKAAFLYHFATFVDWPSSTFKDTKDHLRICIVGKDPFGENLEATLRAKKIGEHPLEIHRNPRQSTLKLCHVLYVTASRSSQLRTYHQQHGNANVLTVGENDTFMQHGGMIKFFMDDHKVRFAINPDAINKTKLKVSSKLLRLAKIITP